MKDSGGEGLTFSANTISPVMMIIRPMRAFDFLPHILSHLTLAAVTYNVMFSIMLNMSEQEFVFTDAVTDSLKNIFSLTFSCVDVCVRLFIMIQTPMKCYLLLKYINRLTD